MIVIDIHTHIFASAKPFPRAALDDPMWSVSDRMGPGFKAKAEAQELARIEDYLDRMDEWGVDIVCVNNVANSGAGARAMNDYNAEIIAANPGRMIGFAALPMAEGENAARELEYAIKELGFYGAKIYPKIQNVPLDADSMNEVYATASDLNVPLLTHTTALPHAYSGTRGMHWMDHTYDNPARVFDSGMMAKYPNLKIIFAHQGGGYVYYKDMLIARNPDSAPLWDRFYVDMSPMSRFSQAQTQVAIDALGLDHVLFGIDYPWANLEEAGKCVAHLKAMDFSDDVKQAILGENAIRLLNLQVNRESKTVVASA